MALIKGNAQQDKIQRYWYQNDQLGTPIRLTDSIGETLYQCEYNAYGQVIDENYYSDHIDTLPDNPLRFQGQYYDEETGLHYNLNRYYDPFVGRYITQDPIGILSDLNSYRYVGNNTIRGIDPTGLELIDVYRGVRSESELLLYDETGWVLSQTGYLTYAELRWANVPIKDALSKAIIQSKAAHAKQIKEWGSLDQYIRAHGEWGQELNQIGRRSLVSFTTRAEKAAEFGSTIIHIKVPKSSFYRQTLETSTENEILFINGVYAK